MTDPVEIEREQMKAHFAMLALRDMANHAALLARCRSDFAARPWRTAALEAANLGTSLLLNNVSQPTPDGKRVRWLEEGLALEDDGPPIDISRRLTPADAS